MAQLTSAPRPKSDPKPDSKLASELDGITLTTDGASPPSDCNQRLFLGDWVPSLAQDWSCRKPTNMDHHNAELFDFPVKCDSDYASDVEGSETQVFFARGDVGCVLDFDPTGAKALILTQSAHGWIPSYFLTPGPRRLDDFTYEFASPPTPPDAPPPFPEERFQCRVSRQYISGGWEIYRYPRRPVTADKFRFAFDYTQTLYHKTTSTSVFVDAPPAIHERMLARSASCAMVVEIGQPGMLHSRPFFRLPNLTIWEDWDLALSFGVYLEFTLDDGSMEIHYVQRLHVPDPYSDNDYYPAVRDYGLAIGIIMAHRNETFPSGPTWRPRFECKSVCDVELDVFQQKWSFPWLTPREIPLTERVPFEVLEEMLFSVAHPLTRVSPPRALGIEHLEAAGDRPHGVKRTSCDACAVFPGLDGMLPAFFPGRLCEAYDETLCQTCKATGALCTWTPLQPLMESAELLFTVRMPPRFWNEKTTKIAAPRRVFSAAEIQQQMLMGKVAGMPIQLRD